MSAPAPTGLLTFGESMGLISTHRIGTLEHAPEARVTMGGAESNVAIGVSRLGGSVTWVGRVGRDAVGDLIEKRLCSEGVNTLAIRDDSFTGLMMRHRRAGATVHVDYHRQGSAGSRLAPSDLPATLISTAKIVHLTGITPALSAQAQATVRHVVDSAAAHIAVSLDLNYRSKLWSADAARATLAPLLARATVVFGGIEEVQLVLNSDCDEPLKLAHQLADRGVSEAIIKDGARGCTAVIDQREYAVPAHQVGVVDPVGAGDAFVAGYLADRLAGASAEERLRTAVAVGAYAVTVPGDCELLPTRAELAALVTAQDIHR